ncbi:MAG: Acetoacetate metabolism regulatory protein AtoC [Nitrospira sp.]
MIVDDEPDAIENCRRILSRCRYDCVVEADPNRALAAIERERPQVLLTDLRMPGLDGIGLLKAAKQIDPTIKVVLLTAYASVQTAVDSMRHGAFDYLAKPFTGRELRTVVRRALGEGADESGKHEDTSLLQAENAISVQEGALIGNSAPTKIVRELIERVAATEAAVLISGESGTGKEYVARTIHAGSVRRLKSFVPVDCLASDEAALERQLFGAEAAAADSDAGSQPGLFELAHGGSLFLDEVDGLSPRLQAKVARALKERRGRRVGGSRFFNIDVRVMAASTQHLQRLCGSGEFREDLYWHLNVVPIELRPLRERVEDIEALAQWFLQTFPSRKPDRQRLPSGFTPRARMLLLRYPWPGNVRELRNAVERAAVIADGSPVDLIHLPDRLASS